jgi:uncharacterized repeat protein (TIGR01451 family)
LTAQYFALAENVGTNEFVSHTLFNSSEAVQYAFGDINGDGQIDFIYYVNESIYYRENIGGFAFGLDQLVYDFSLVAGDPDNCSFYPPLGNEAYGNVAVMRIQAGDLNNDGDDEIIFLFNGDVFANDAVLGCSNGNLYSIDYDNGNFLVPEFEVTCTTASLNYSWYYVPELQIMDIDQDGWNDIMYIRHDPMGSSMVFQLATGNGIIGSNFTYFNWGFVWDSYDVNGDGDTEMIMWDPYYTIQVEGYSDWVFGGIGYYAAGVVCTDYDGDNDGDIFGINQEGMLNIAANEGLWPTSAGDDMMPNVSYLETGIAQFVSDFSKFDYDGDGDEDLLVLAEGHLYVIPIIATADDYTNLTANTFFDTNENGIRDSLEQAYGWANIQLSLQGSSPSTYYTSYGQLSLLLDPGIYEMTALDNSIFFDPSNASPLIIDLTNTSDTVVIDIPYITQGEPVFNVSSSLYSNPGICDSPFVWHYLTVSNTGNIAASGTIEYQLDGIHSFISSSLPPSSVSGNTVTWSYSNLAPTSVINISVLVSAANSSDLGTIATYTLTSTIEDEFNNIIFTDNEIDTYEITCSYDPNDITEHNGHTDAGYTFAGDELEYTIRFQNTGNAPAQDVRIENQLSEKLDWSSMQPVAWSHDFDLMIDENGLATFTFDNIMLPDSVNDEANSHGFVRYRITSDSDLIAGEIIENTASIFFDFNPAVVTNTEINTIYDCVDLQQATASATEVCAGDAIIFENNATWIENLTWSFNDVQAGEGNYTHLLNQSGVMTVSASNSLCTYSQTWNLVANEATATFTNTVNLLSANAASTYQWYLNGNEIPNATAQNFEIMQTGNYSVMITDDNGCSAMSDSMMVTYIGVNEKTKNSISVYPNPIAEISTVQVPENLLGKYFHVYTTSGELVLSGKLNGRSHPINCEDLAPGVYVLRVENERIMLVKS